MKAEKIIKELKKLEDMFDFSNLDDKHELFSDKNKIVIGKIKIETPRNIRIDEFSCLRSKPFSFKCRDGFINELEAISRSQQCNLNLKNIKSVQMERNIKENVIIIF